MNIKKRYIKNSVAVLDDDMRKKIVDHILKSYPLDIFTEHKTGVLLDLNDLRQDTISHIYDLVHKHKHNIKI